MRYNAGTEWNYFIEISDGKGIKHSERADFLFIKDSGTNTGYPMNPDSITSWLNKFSEKNNLPHINPYAFRHTLASVLCLNGIDITTISKWLGHKDVTTTIPIPNSNTKPTQYLPTIISNIFTLIIKGRYLTL